jgi:hypothetical protein
MACKRTLPRIWTRVKEDDVCDPLIEVQGLCRPVRDAGSGSGWRITHDCNSPGDEGVYFLVNVAGEDYSIMTDGGQIWIAIYSNDEIVSRYDCDGFYLTLDFKKWIRLSIKEWVKKHVSTKKV